jgi:DNA repair protein RecN (Recombination protein N)
VLTGLRLENIALIESLELGFGSGFTVLTGETGAGKSLLLDALDALLGGAEGSRGARLLRPQSERALIEASFSLRSLSLRTGSCCSAANGDARPSG